MAKTEEGTKISFLGGNNEYRIGANSIMVEHTENDETKRILLDDGAMFPPDWIDYDAAIPDMRDYFENPYGEASKKVDAMFVTHCHEDHIGGLVFLAAAKYKLPKIYASRDTLDFIKNQLNANNTPEEYIPEMQEVEQGQSVDFGNVKVSPFNMSHSTAGALGYHIGTTLHGKNNAGLVFTGDYHLGKVNFGKGFEEESYKDFIKDKYVSHVFMDSTSATMDESAIVTYDKAVENTANEVKKHPQKQIFSAVIARSIQNLSVDLRAAYETGRTIFIASKGLRDAYKVFIAQAKDGNEKIREMLGLPKGENFDISKLVYGADDIDRADAQSYINKFPPSERYMIVSGAFAEDKDGRKSCLVTMSEQNKVTIDEQGRVKGKGKTGHPIFTVDKNTLFMLRQRPIESINGEKHRALVGRLQSLGSTVVLNGDDIDSKYQRTGHSTRQESEQFFQMTVKNCQNSAEFANHKKQPIAITIHGDLKQLSDLSHILKEQGAKPLICINTDEVNISDKGTKRTAGTPFEAQEWICVKAESMNNFGKNDVFTFDLCDHNLMRKEHLLTVMNLGANSKGLALQDRGHQFNRILNKYKELEEQEGQHISNVAIRVREQSKDKSGRNKRSVKTYSPEEIAEYCYKSKTHKFTRRNGRGGRD